MTDELPATRFVKPAVEGARIPDPAHPGHDLPAEGAEVPWVTHWIIRLNRGEVVEINRPAPPAAEPPASA